MKAEKIQKHMLRRTVVVGATNGAVKGVINSADGSAAPVFVAGVSRLSKLHGGLYGGWFPPEDIRKATDAERAEFFEWLVSDGRDIADNFARFGGVPRGFEAWRAAQDAPVEPPAEEPTPTPAAPHKVGDLRVWLRSNGIGAVARIMAAKDGAVAFAEYKVYRADAVLEPTLENVARLVAEQRERGIKPELGDLVFVVRALRKVTREIGIVSWCLEGREIKVTSISDGGDGEESCYYPRLYDAHVLVIRRCPFREVADV